MATHDAVNAGPILIRRAEPRDADPLAVLAMQVWVHNYAKSGIHPTIARYVLDTRRLTEFGSDLRQDTSIALLPFYALNGTLDELRLSNVARARFESADLR